MQHQKNQFASELKFSYKPLINPVKIRGAKDAEHFLIKIWDKSLLNTQEQFYVMYLNQVNEVICWRCLHTGSMIDCNLDIRLLLSLGCLATSIIIAHNHPTGNVIPSIADRNVTDKVEKACKLVGLSMKDHLIINRNSCFSFLEEKLN